MAEFDDKLNALLANPQAMEQIMQMAQSLMGPQQDASAQQGQASQPAAPAAQGGEALLPQAPAPPLPAPEPAGATGVLPGLGGLDAGALAALMPLLRELGGSRNTQARQVLFALRPYLKPERQDKVERALQLARLFRVGRRFLLKGDGHV